MEPARARKQLVGVLLSACAVSLTLGASGCAWIHPPTQTQVTTPARSQGEGRPLNLTPSVWPMTDSAAEAVVRVVGDGSVTCTGTLIADDLVLTAHHCVSARDRKGHVERRDMAPEDVQIELGGDDLPWGEVKVRAIVAPQCGYVMGDGDVAILVLDRHLVGVPTVSARIESRPESSGDLKVFGFGHCAATSDPVHHREIIHREPRDSGPINAITPGEFEAQAHICPGDSGGPVYDRKNELIGVVSAAVMFPDDSTKGRSVFTRIDVWPQLFATAHEISLGASPSELPPYGECPKPAPRPKAADLSRKP